jgi:hypothetical protein
MEEFGIHMNIYSKNNMDEMHKLHSDPYFIAILCELSFPCYTFKYINKMDFFIILN